MDYPTLHWYVGGMLDCTDPKRTMPLEQYMHEAAREAVAKWKERQ